MIKCLLCTIIIEVTIAIMLKVKEKKDILNIVLVNCITNPLVVTIPILIYIKYSYKIKCITLIVLEILTVITEGLIYYKALKYKKINPLILSLILNLSSYIIGELINKL